MDWQSYFNGESLPWLLDPADPGVRYLALRDLQGLPLDNPKLLAAQKDAHVHGPIAIILDHMQPDGFWVRPGPGYNPKYTSTVWSLSLLAQLGASVHCDERIARACAYYLQQALTKYSQISASGAPSGTVDCLQGNLCWALVELRCDDPRLELAFDWMGRSVTGEGIAPLSEKDTPVRYYAGKCNCPYSRKAG